MGENPTSTLVLFVFISLLLVIVCYELKKKLRFPVAPILLFVGILFRALGDTMEVTKSTVGLLDNLDAEIILYVLLPVLIFEASTDLEWYTFKRELPQIIPMATTVVLASSLLNTVAIKLILFPYFSWTEAYTLGTIISATDHVAVCAQLKEVSAHKRLSTLITGETLLNDAAVLVLFYVGLESEPGGASVAEFLRLSFGGFFVGIVFSLVLGYWLGRIINDAVQETTITLVGAYLTYYFGDSEPLKVSGAIAVVTLGLFMAAYGKTLISPPCEAYYRSFWSLAGRNVESLVFIFAGMVIELSFAEQPVGRIKDMFKSLALFVMLYAFRAIAIAAHYPVLRYFGYGLSIKEAVVVSLSGTKGAITIALAMVTYHSDDFATNIRKDILFHATMVSALTIIFGSFVVKYLIKKFDLQSMSEIQERMMVGVTQSIIQKTDKKLGKLKRDKEYSLADWGKVETIAGPDHLMKHVLSTTKSGKNIVRKSNKSSSHEMLDYFRLETRSLEMSFVERETRRRYIGVLRGSYWEQFKAGQCMGYSVVLLCKSCNKAMDSDSEPLNDWAFLEKSAFQSKVLKFLFYLSKIPCIGRLFIQFIYQRLSITYDVCTTFIKAHEEALEALEKMEIDFDPAAFDKISLEVREQVQLCSRFIQKYINRQYPEVIEVVQTNMACQALLKYQMKLIDENYERGLIEELEFERMEHALTGSIKKLSFHDKPRIPSLRSLLKKRFPNVPEEKFFKIKEQHFKVNDFLFKEDTETGGAFLILNGIVREWSDWIDQELSIGNIVGVQHLLPYIEKNLTTAQALSIVRVALVPKSFIEDELMIEDLYREASEEILLYNCRVFGLDCKKESIYYLCMQAGIIKIQPQESILNNNGIFVLMGQLEDICAYAYIPPDNSIYQAQETSIIMELPPKLGDLVKKFNDISDSLNMYSRLTFRKSKNEKKLGFTTRQNSKRISIRAD